MIERSHGMLALTEYYSINMLGYAGRTDCGNPTRLEAMEMFKRVMLRTCFHLQAHGIVSAFVHNVHLAFSCHADSSLKMIFMTDDKIGGRFR